MIRSTLACLSVSTLLAMPAARAQDVATPAAGEGDSPVAAVQALFDAMAAHDAASARRLIAPGAPLLVVREDGSLHVGKDAGFLEALAKDTASWRERGWNAEVRIDGPMAQVWMPYDFHHGGTFSHCGTNSVTLARGAEGWQVVAIAYTMRKDGCPAGAPAP